MSDQLIEDDVFARLLTFPNVLVTGHQGFFTTDALTAIAKTTVANIEAFKKTGRALHEVMAPTRVEGAVKTAAYPQAVDGRLSPGSTRQAVR